MVAINMTKSVMWLEEASQTNKLIVGVVEGSMKGNIAQPTVAMIPVTLIALHNHANLK